MSIWKCIKNCSSTVWGCLSNQSPAFQSIGVIVIPIALFWAANIIKGADDRQAQQLREQQEQQAKTARAQTVVANYFNQLSTILIQGDLKRNPELSAFLTASTITLLQDPDIQDNQQNLEATCPNPDNPDQQISYSRKELVVKHLIQAGLVQSTSWSIAPTIFLEGLQNPGLNNLCLVGANLDRSHLSRTSLRRANLKKANLIGADLRSASLYEADLEEANMTMAQLNKSPDSDCYYTAPDFPTSTELESKYNFGKPCYNYGANLAGADMSQANLSQANLDGTIFYQNSSEARGLTPEQVKAANSWEKAVYSPAFRQQLGLPPE